MKSRSERTFHIKNPCRPAFLDSLDSDRDSALEEFYRFLKWTLGKVPPRPIRRLSKEDQEDMIQKVYLHCTKDNARVLRQYVPSGKSFAAWLYTVAHHLCIDHIRTHRPSQSAVSIYADPHGEGLEYSLANPIDEEKKGVAARYVQIAREIIKQLDYYCRLLLEMAADEFTPKEMVLVLRLPKSDNKKVSDDLRYCREKLRKRLEDRGIDVDVILKS